MLNLFIVGILIINYLFSGTNLEAFSAFVRDASGLRKGWNLYMKYKAEALDLLNYLTLSVNEPLMRYRIDLFEHLDETVFVQAVTRSMDTFPLIRCGFRESRIKPYWEEKDLTGKDIVTVREDSNVNEQIKRTMTLTTIDYYNGPQLKIIIVRSVESDTLCFIINHMICDGAGFTQYLKILGELYSAIKKNISLPVAPFCPRDLKPLLTGKRLKEIIDILRTENEILASIDSEKQYGVTFDKHCDKPNMMTRSISAEQLAKLKCFGKTRNATLNDILMTLYARSLCKNMESESLILFTLMNLRKLIPTDKHLGICNCSTICKCIVSVKTEDVFDGTLRQISEQMTYYKTGKIALKDVIGWDILAHVFPFIILKRYCFKNVKPPIVTFSNVGILESRFGDLAIKNAYITASVKRSPFFEIVLSTCQDRCTLTSNFYGDDDYIGWVNRFFDDIFVEIEHIEHINID